MSQKDCGQHEDERKKLYRRIFAALLGFIILILFIILVVFLVLRPTKPRFFLQDATIYNFNVSEPNFLTTTLQITLSSRNPNDRIGIYYDKVDVFAKYHGQQITLPTLLPPSYQGHNEITVWSPFVCGTAVPIAPYYAHSLEQEQFAGTVLVNIKVEGRVRWKVGTFISGKYHLNVNCPAYINFGKNNNFGVGVATMPMKYQFLMDCQVDV